MSKDWMLDEVLSKLLDAATDDLACEKVTLVRPQTLIVIIEELRALRAVVPPGDMRSDYIAGHVWCNQLGVPALSGGKPATLVDRIKMLGRSREEMAERFARLQPLRSVLGDYDWTGAKEDGVMPDGAEAKVIDAMAYVEAEERKAKEGSSR